MRTADLGVDEAYKCLREKLGVALESPVRRGDMAVLVPPAPDIPDDTTKILIRNAAGRQAAVLLCSRAAAPDLVARGQRMASYSKSVLGEDLGRVILEPIISGDVDGLSYVVLPWRRPLSDSRWFWPMQRAMLRPALFRWLRQATQATTRDPEPDEIEPGFLVPLQHIADQTQLSETIRRKARSAISGLAGGKWKPKHVLDHNDLYRSNILLDPSNKGILTFDRRFIIIDWLGANPDGYGIYDLLRLASSMRLPSYRLAGELHLHCRLVGCSPVDSVGQLLAGLGHLGIHLECFPYERYVCLVESCCKTLFSFSGE